MLMDYLDSFLTVTVNELVGTTSLPDTPWIRLRDLECFVIGTKLISTADGSTFSELSQWISAAGFSGVRFLGRPAIAHTDEATGPMQEIPTVYFRKERGSYGASLSRVSMDQTPDEMDAAARDDVNGCGEPDWMEVLVSREDIVRYIQKNGWQIERMASGAPGRPTSMHLVRLEFDRRMKDGRILNKKSDEAKYLESWLKERYPTQPPLTAKTISNNLTDIFQKARGQTFG